MPLLNDDELRAIREEYDSQRDTLYWHGLKMMHMGAYRALQRIPALLAHAAALQEEVGALRAVVEPAQEYVKASGADYVGTSYRARCYEDLWAAVRKYQQAEESNGA